VLEGLTPAAEQASHVTKIRRYFWSRDNPDAAHIRVVDLDLTAITGGCVGVALTLFLLQGPSWLLAAMVLGAVATAVAPVKTYLRVIRSGHRRFERERARERRRARAPEPQPR
jgi:hypothetical protein